MLPLEQCRYIVLDHICTPNQLFGYCTWICMLTRPDVCFQVDRGNAVYTSCFFVGLFLCFVCLLACLFVCSLARLFVCLFVRLFVGRLFVCLFVCLFVGRLFVCCLFVCLFVCLLFCLIVCAKHCFEQSEVSGQTTFKVIMNSIWQLFFSSLSVAALLNASQVQRCFQPHDTTTCTKSLCIHSGLGQCQRPTDSAVRDWVNLRSF